MIEDIEKTEFLKKEFLIKNTDFVVGNITRFDDNKNTLFTIRVFFEIKKLYPQAVLLLGGPDGGLLSKAKDLVKELNLKDAVRFIGTRTDIADCLKLIDVYLFPSKFEGLGIVALETQASGCLCVASTGVSKEADMKMGTMFFLDLNQSEKYWANQIKILYKNRKITTKDDIKKAFIEKGYNIENTSQALINIYEK